MGDAMTGAETFASRGWTGYEAAKDVIEGELNEQEYLFGEWFTAADVMIGSLLMWEQLFSGPSDRPKIAAYVDRLSKRPSAMKMGG